MAEQTPTLAAYEPAAWATWRERLRAHVGHLRSVLPREAGGAALDDHARQYVTHALTDRGVMEAQVLEVDTGTVDFAIDTVVWSAPLGTDRAWPEHAAAGAHAPQGWIELADVAEAAVTVEELDAIAANLPLDETSAARVADSLRALRAAVDGLDDGRRGVLRTQEVPRAPARAQEDWTAMGVASRLFGAVAAVNAAADDVEIAEPYVQMRMRGLDDAFEVRYRLGYPQLTGSGSVMADNVGLPALAVALYRGAQSMTEHAALTSEMGDDELQQMILDSMQDPRWWIGADPGFDDLVHRVWDLCLLTGVPVSLSWSVDGAWALSVADDGLVKGVGVGTLTRELDRQRAIASA